MATKLHLQTARFISALCQQLPELSGTEMQYWIERPVEFKRVLANSFSSGPSIIDCSQRLKITEFLGSGWSVAQEDPRSFTLNEVDFSKVSFETCLKEGETSIKGEEKLTRLAAMEQSIRLGDNAFLALWQDYQERGEHSVLEWLRKNRGVTNLDFFGSILQGPGGSRCVLYLGWSGGCWRWRYSWLDRGWRERSFSVVLAS